MSQLIKESNYTSPAFDKVRIVMVDTTEPGNIGAAARAMKNMSLSRLFLVNPNKYPSAAATARASGADDVLSNAVVCSSLEEALEGVHLVIGASARQRNIKWKQMDVLDTCKEIQKTLAKTKQQVAVIFGTENFGLTNKEIDLCHILMTIPGNPYIHLEQVLDHIDYFDENRPKSLLMRRLRRLFGRSYPEKEEVSILRGILKGIKPYNKKPD